MTLSNNITLHPVISPEQIRARVGQLADSLKADLGDERPVLLGVLKGCFMFFTDLARQLDLDADIDFVRLASYGAGIESSGRVHMVKSPEVELKGRTVIIVEDIVDTGLTMRWLIDHLAQLGPKRIKVCAFIDKPERRQTPVEIDYVGFHVPEGFLVGYGLDYNEKYRNLAGVFEVRFEPSDRK
ncbi:hypoxanthine phosphoribosyltransferase [Desulfarculus baarsii DSM 2075]|uniref:Hypoxanthine phosphoribosyltransferase n=1 Tax=Desulfarculus baarsii (strain ATCC 33931 / DSM 2075 / LMG 7858 / VKM B-1802 / 2st14) TaxID=644282 RepID=E1QIN1_DESB2|nr:hypoxanthine phosphoribosyltransferase [Desulfarculus baarsii]ADK84454.1 hypoxanthine phosphoribosyltransferase [Desulfarculus baarsii DSM 2075]